MTAIASRDAARADAFVRELELRAHASYEALLAVAEAEAFASMIATGAPGDSGWTRDETIDTLAMIEALYASARADGAAIAVY